MKFDRPLRVGAVGGHSSIRYRITKYVPGSFIEFTFMAPKGFDGIHSFEITPCGSGETELKHIVAMRTRGADTLSWLVAIRPLHDALLEDAMAKVEAMLGLPSRRNSWSLSVKLLRRSLGVGKSSASAA